MFSILTFAGPQFGALASKANTDIVNEYGVSDIWICAAIIFVVFMAVAVISALCIDYKPGGSDKFTRRIWFWVSAFLAAAVNYIYLRFFWMTTIYDQALAQVHGGKLTQKLTEHLDSLNSHLLYSTIAVLAGFIILGCILSTLSKRSKLGTWF